LLLYLPINRKFGFVIEGRLTNFAYRDGQYVDSYFMVRLR